MVSHSDTDWIGNQALSDNLYKKLPLTVTGANPPRPPKFCKSRQTVTDQRTFWIFFEFYSSPAPKIHFIVSILDFGLLWYHKSQKFGRLHYFDVFVKLRLCIHLFMLESICVFLYFILMYFKVCNMLVRLSVWDLIFFYLTVFPSLGCLQGLSFCLNSSFSPKTTFRQVDRIVMSKLAYFVLKSKGSSHFH